MEQIQWSIVAVCKHCGFHRASLRPATGSQSDIALPGLRRARCAFAANQEDVFVAAASLLSIEAEGGHVKWERVGGVALLPSGEGRTSSAQRARPPHIRHLLDHVHGEKKTLRAGKKQPSVWQRSVPGCVPVVSVVGDPNIGGVIRQRVKPSISFSLFGMQEKPPGGLLEARYRR